MATKTILVDDIEGKEGADVQTYTFTHEGQTYEIDLNDKNAKKMHEAFSFYANHGRRVSGGRKASTSTARRTASKVTAEDREWLRKNGFPNIKKIGRLPKAAEEALANR